MPEKTEIDQLITTHFEKVLDAMRKEDQQAVFSACYAFGELIHKHYPNLKKLDEIQASLSEIKITIEDLPSLKLASLFSEARSYLQMNLVGKSPPEDLAALNIESIGLDVFLTLIYQSNKSKEAENQLAELGKSIDFDSAEYLETEKLIKSNLPSVQAAAIEEECKTLENELIKTIQTEIRKNSLLFKDYIDNTADIQKDKIKKLTEIIKNKTFLNEKNKHALTPQLKLAVGSLHAVHELQKTLQENKDKKASEKLTTFKEKFEDEKIQTALKTNPDSAVKKFLKQIAYHLTNAITFGALSAQKDAWLNAPQQLFHKKINEKLSSVSSFIENDTTPTKKP